MSRKKTQSVKKILSKVSHPKFKIFCAVLVVAACGFATLSYVTRSSSSARSDQREVDIKPAQKTAKNEDKKLSSISPEISETRPSAQPSTAPSPKKSSPTNNYSPAPTPDISPRYYVTNISSAFLACADHGPNYPKDLYLSLGSVNIFGIGPVGSTFSWRVEGSYGSIHKSGTSTMSSNQNSWQSFPSTESDPQGLGTIIGIKNGEKVRFVITSPSYTATAWTNPVPAGSEYACQLGQITGTYL